MLQLIRGLLVVVAVILPAASPAARTPSTYFHFHNISSAGDFEAGHVRGNPWHWVSRIERQRGGANSGQVRWSGKGSSGTQVWDLDHGHPQVEEAHQQYPDRKSSEPRVGVGPGPGCPLHAHVHGQGGAHQRLQRRSHSTLITRDCQGNPLEPPGVRLSPGLPRLPLRPPPPPPPAAPPSPVWRLADQTQPPPPPPPPPAADVYLHINKRAGELAVSAETPRGFEPTAQEQDLEGQEDHLRGMTHADGQLMFGDGSYQAPAALRHLRPLRLPLKSPTIVIKGPLKGTAFKGPVAVRLQPYKPGMGMGAPAAGSTKARPKPMVTPMVARLKPMVVLVKPAASNRLPQGGKGPTGAVRPLPLREWFASMLGRM